ncbi:reverse transcriptase domain-containing protein, partial [Tanacetum coccineum]
MADNGTMAQMLQAPIEVTRNAIEFHQMLLCLTTEVSEPKNLMKTMLIDKQKSQVLKRKATHSRVFTSAAANFNQGNTNSRPPMVANQIRPPGFPPIQNNQNRFNPNQGNNFNQIEGTISIKNRTNKEKLEEIAITTVNAECSAIIMNKVPEMLEDLGKFLIPCALQELDRTNALADSGASINLLPHSIYKQLGLGALTPTRMTLELANRSIMYPMGIAEDVVVRVDEEKLTLRVGSDELVFYAEKSKKSKNKQFAHAISVIDFSKDKPFSGSTTNDSDALLPSSSLVKTSDNLGEFADELTLSKKVVHEEIFQVYSNPLFEFDDNFTSSNVNHLFNEMVEDVVKTPTFEMS